jgi:hypothetical protein
MNIDEEAKQIKVSGSKSIESRKKMNFMARFFLSVTILGTFIFLIWLLFFTELKADSRDLVNILSGLSSQFSRRQRITGSKIKMILNTRKLKY